MKKIFNAAFMMLAALAISLSFGSCTDETALFGSNGYGDGKATVTLDFSFEALNNALDTRGTKGDLDFGINNLVILFYDADKEDNVKPVYTFNFQNSDFEVYEKELRNPAHCEEKTYHGMVTLEDVEYGDYRIYVVANVIDKLGDKTDEGKYTITEEALRTISIKWPQSTDGEQQGVPDAMFGYFTYEDLSQHPIETYRNVIYHPNYEDLYLNKEESSTDHTSQNLAPKVTLNKRNLEIQAWLKRVVSKLTIGFDGTGLKSGVEIYIKSVRIADAAGACLLGQDNSVKNKSEFITYDPEATEQDPRLYTTYELGEGDAVVKITRETPAYPREGLDEKLIPDANFSENKAEEDKNNDGWHDAWYEYVHGSTTNTNPTYKNTPITLYFFENLQGIDKKNTKVKLQTKEGVEDFPNHLDPNHSDSEEQQTKDGYCLFKKDGKPNGTYVEVKAYYKNTKTGKNTQGDITYRFMLGKNIENDFNAERNHHYKLTLSFIGDANSADWHIDYDEERIPYFPIPDQKQWEQSNVWHAYDDDGNPIAEMVRELVYYDPRDPNYEYGFIQSNNTRYFLQVVTVYPVVNGVTDLKNGRIAQVLHCDNGDMNFHDTQGDAVIAKYLNDIKKVDVRLSMYKKTERHANKTENPDKGTGEDAVEYYRGYNVISALDWNWVTSDAHNLQKQMETENNHWVIIPEEETDDEYLFVEIKNLEDDFSKLKLGYKQNYQYRIRPYQVTDYNNNKYPIVKIGAAYWTGENCRATNYMTGEQIYPYNSATEYGYSKGPGMSNMGYVYFDDRFPMYINSKMYGMLYNYFAVSGTEADGTTSKGYPFYGSESDPYFGYTYEGNISYLSHSSNLAIMPENWELSTTYGAVDYYVSNPAKKVRVDADNIYLEEYMGNNLCRAFCDKQGLTWSNKHIISILSNKKNLSGLSLLPIPALAIAYDTKNDNALAEISFDGISEGELNTWPTNNSLANLYIPYWEESLAGDKNAQYCDNFYPCPPILLLSDVYKQQLALYTPQNINQNMKYAKLVKDIYLPIRFVRNELGCEYSVSAIKSREEAPDLYSF